MRMACVVSPGDISQAQRTSFCLLVARYLGSIEECEQADRDPILSQLSHTNSVIVLLRRVSSYISVFISASSPWLRSLRCLQN